MMLVLLVPLSAFAKKVCEPAPDFPESPGRSISLPSVGLQLDLWDEVKKMYFPQGLLVAHTIHEEEFGAMTHGAYIRSSDVLKRRAESTDLSFSDQLPPVYFTATYVDKFYRINSINASAAPLGSGLFDRPWQADLTLLGEAIAPSTVYAAEKVSADGAKLQGFYIAQGNPFVMDKGNHSKQLNLGGITFMSSSGCTDLFPVFPDPYAATGRVANTIECHPGTGMCFFTLWKFDGMNMPIYPDCLWYCKPDNLTNPTKCASVGVLKDESGKKICRDYRLGGGVHGLMIGHTDPSDPATFDIILVFTKGMGYTKGGSWMSKIVVTVTDTGTPVTNSQHYWGTSLWNETVAAPNDVGCDHAFLDEAGMVWVSTFRSKNAGIHMLDYNGLLRYSIHGFTDFTPGEYSYPAGLSGYGTLFRNNSLMALATSSEKIGIPIFGVSNMFVIDTTSVKKQ